MNTSQRRINRKIRTSHEPQNKPEALADLLRDARAVLSLIQGTLVQVRYANFRSRWRGKRTI